MADKYLCSEGDTDRVVFEHLLQSKGYDISPKKPKPCTSKEPGGEIAALNTTITLVKQGVPLVVAALDLNGDNFSKLCADAEAALNKKGISLKGGNGDYTAEKTRLKIVPVGLPENQFLVSLGVKSHSIDDFLLVLLHEKSIYDQFLEAEPKLKAPDFETAFSGLEKAVETLRGKRIPVDRSKQMLDLLRTILGFRASPATLAEKILKAAPPPTAEDLLRPLAEAIP